VRRKGAVTVELHAGRLTSALAQGRLPGPRRSGILVQSLGFGPVD